MSPGLPAPRRVAVIGSGVAGLTAAYVASFTARVTLFEADSRLGGHADTHRVGDLAIDTGFIVHNQRTYPTLLRMLAELGVATQPAEMSMSVRDEATGLEYAGARGARGLFPSPRNLARPAYLRMLTEIPRFHRRARALLAAEGGTSPASAAGAGSGGEETLREFLARGRFSAYFTRHFTEALVAAVWSCDPERALDYPARYLFAFLDHHGMLGVLGSPQWRTVVGGSAEYVRRVADLVQDVRPGTKVVSVADGPDAVAVTDGNGVTETFDAVVVATHPDQALAMLAEPTPQQREVLSAMPYSANTALLHTDRRLLPRAAGARASWNFLRRAQDTGRVTVTYDLTRLMRLPTPTRYLVTLGAEDLVDPSSVIDTMEYAHPLYTPESVAAQRRLPEIRTDRLVFAGAYSGWGFHEDGARSGLAAARALGLDWPERTPAPTVRAGLRNRLRESGRVSVRGRRTPVASRAGDPAPSRDAEPRAGGVLYAATITHTRRSPWQRRFTYRNHTWLVDLDALPDHGVLGRFEARDHLGDPGRTIRQNVETLLAAHGIGLAGGRVLMAANARAFGYCFNPISVHWCFAADDSLAAVVVEVHNTYGDRHAYLVRPDDQGRARTDKLMYVSPFHGVDGVYDLAVPVPDDRLRVAVRLRTGDGEVFSASLSGRRTRSGPWRAAPAALLGSARIRLHGVRLWLRRLPVRPRPVHTPQEGVQ